MYMYVHWCAEQEGVWTKLLGKSLNDYWVSSMLLYEKHLMLSVFFFPIITSQIMPLTSKIVHPVLNEHSATVCALLIALKHFHSLAHMSYNYSINYKLLFFVKKNLINIEADKFKTIEIRLQLIFRASDRMWWCRFT